jgi:effector-binding domain-containing protein
MKKHLFSFILLLGLLLPPFCLYAQDKDSKAPGSVIKVQQVEVQKTIVVRFDVASSEIGPSMGKAFEKLFGFLGANGIAPVGPPFAVYYSYDPSGHTVFEAGIPVSDTVGGNDEVMYKEFPAMKVVTTQFQGPYDAMEPVYTELFNYIAANGLTSDGTSWEVYLTDPSQVADPKDNLSVIYLPLK